MAKRLNPHRRLLAQQAKALSDAMATFGKAHDDSGKLQQGPVKSGLNVRVHLSAYSEPRSNWEGNGQRVRKSVKRWAIK